jgi:hypothetical protein
MTITHDNETIIKPDVLPLELELPCSARDYAILILREDFRLTHRAIGERVGLAERTITFILNEKKS